MAAHTRCPKSLISGSSQIILTFSLWTGFFFQAKLQDQSGTSNSHMLSNEPSHNTIS